MSTSCATQGALPLEAVQVTIHAPTGIDLSTTQSAVIEVTRQNGTIVVWPATLVSVSANKVVVLHTFQAGDVPDVEILRLIVVLTLAGAVIRLVTTAVCSPVLLETSVTAGSSLDTGA